MNRMSMVQKSMLLLSAFLFMATTSVYAQGMGPGGRKGDCPRFRDGKGFGPGYGRHMRHGRRHRRGPFFGNIQRMKDHLSLSDAQVSKIEKINLRFKKAHLSLKEKMVPKKIRIRRLLLEENVDLKKVKVLLRNIADVEVELRYLKIRHRVAIEKVLTPDQKRKLRSERKRKWHRRHRRF